MEDKARNGSAQTKAERGDKAKKFRSPQFPFIPLEKAVARAREFEAAYHQQAIRTSSAVKTWGYTNKSSGGIQTIAALVAYGLLEDQGSLEGRRLNISALAMTILKDARAGAAPAALKVAALKPNVIAELWETWGPTRPPDHDCISTLYLDMKFSEEAAGRLLQVYDATITFSGLAESDKINDNQNRLEDVVQGRLADKTLPSGKKPEPVPLIPPPQRGKVPLMPDERILFTYEQGPSQSVRILVTGQMDAELADVLKKFAEFQVAIAPKNAATEKKDGEPAADD